MGISRKDFSERYLDILQEVGNIGVGNAVTSLSQLINRRVDMTVPKAKFTSTEEVLELVGKNEELVSCVSLGLLGEISGVVLFIFSEKSTYYLVDALFDLEPGTTTGLDEMSRSAVMEIGNMLAGSFVSAISMMSGLKMHVTLPTFGFDMLGAVFTSLLVASGRIEEQILVIETEVGYQEGTQITGHFFMLTEPGSIEFLMSALSTPFEDSNS